MKCAAYTMESQGNGAWKKQGSLTPILPTTKDLIFLTFQIIAIALLAHFISPRAWPNSRWWSKGYLRGKPNECQIFLLKRWAKVNENLNL
jgi:hypothetical protein